MNKTITRVFLIYENIGKTWYLLAFFFNLGTPIKLPQVKKSFRSSGPQVVSLEVLKTSDHPVNKINKINRQ
jgi:hypothetical protein